MVVWFQFRGSPLWQPDFNHNAPLIESLGITQVKYRTWIHFYSIIVILISHDHYHYLEHHCYLWTGFHHKMPCRNELIPIFTPAQFPSPPGGEFTIRASGTTSSMQAKPGPQTYLAWITCNAMTELWSTGCAVSPPRSKSVRKISYIWCSLKMWQRYSSPANLDGPTMKNVMMVGWRKSRNSIPQEVMAMANQRKPGTDYLVLGLTEKHPSDRKAWSGKLRSAFRLDPPL